jgi:hypothetical protein
MVKVAIGAVVLCHLLSGTPKEGEQPKIFKLLGSVVEINVGKVPKIYEDPERRVAYRVLGDELLIRAKDGSGIYQVDVNACMLVKESSDEEVQQVFKDIKEKEQAIKDQEAKKTGEETSGEKAIEEQNRPSVQEVTNKISEAVEDNIIRPKPTVKPKEKKEVAPAPMPKEEKKEEVKVEAPKVEEKPVAPVEEKKEVAPPAPKVEEKKEEVKPEASEKKEEKKSKDKGLMDYILE